MSSAETFGAWLRRRRRALDMTQQQLADCAGCSLVTVRKFESDERRPSKLLAELVADCLGIPMDERERFVQFARQPETAAALPAPATEPPPLPAPSPLAPAFSPAPVAPLPIASPASAASSNLPAPLTSLVGREREIAEVVALLERSGARLVTLTGPGGTGKTRLATEAARAMLEAETQPYPDGVWFVDLTGVAEPERVIPTVAETLGLAEQAGQSISAALTAHLRPLRLLLVLDNFEQVLDAAPELTSLLTAAAGLRLLVTSRAVLQVYGEYEYPVAPLPLPDATRDWTPDGLLASPAVALFVERSRAVRATFALTAENAPAVAEICRRLDGLPLAIELAAARSKLFNPPALLAQLGSSLNLSARSRGHVSDRQRTLRGAIEWSYRLLDEEEQRLFRALGVFAGPFAPADAAAIPGDETDEFELADQLVALSDRSMTRRLEPIEEMRFRLLAVLREYAQEMLVATGEWDAARAAHARHYLLLAQETAPLLEGKEQAEGLARLSAAGDDLRAALSYALEQPERCADGLRLATALRAFWRFRGLFTEGREWLRQLIESALPDTPVDLLANAYSTAGMLARYQDDHDEALRLLHTSLDLWQSQGNAADRKQMSVALRNIAAIHYWRDELEQSERYSLEILAIDRELGNQSAVATMLGNLSSINKLLGRFDLARQYQTEALALHRQTSGPAAIMSGLNGLGLLEFHEGNLAESRRLFEESLAMARSIDDPYHQAMVLSNLAEGKMVRGDLVGARADLEASRELARKGGYTRLGQTATFNLGLLRLLEGGGAAEAWPLMRDPLRYWQGAAIKVMLDVSLYPIALLLSRAGRHEAAVQLIAHVDANTRNPVRSPDFAMIVDEVLPAARLALGEAGCAEAHPRGRALSLAEATDLALSEGEAAAVEAAMLSTGALAGLRYVSERLLATGGMGEVYLGRDRLTGESVVIKRLRPELLAADPSAVARFRREGELLQAVNDPALVRLLEAGEEGGRAYLVMEYVPGGTLRQLLERQESLPAPQAVEVVRALAGALAKAHGLGIIHRDLKPENVLLTADGSPRLTDFGLAYRPTSATRLTEPGTVVGTVAYLSPEACRGEEPDAAGDLWALGVMLVEMVAGRHPFARDNAAATVLAIVNPAGPSLEPMDLPRPLAALAARLLSPDPARRPSCAGDLERELARITANLTT